MSAFRVLSTVVVTASLILGNLVPAAAQEADPHYAAGVTAFNSGDYPKAIAEMNASLAAAPTGKAALYLGNAHLKLGQLGAAKAALERALQLDPGNPKRESILALIKGIEERDTARVRITSTPPGAIINVDSDKAGAARGRTPNEVLLKPGRHEIILSLEGHETEKRTQQFKTGEKVTLEFTLRPKLCEVSLSAEPAAASASVDGAPPLALPAKASVGVGEHKVTFTAAGFESQELAATCDGANPIALGAKLVAIVLVGRVKFPAAQGTIIAVDGKVLSGDEIAQGVTLPVGRHEITFTLGNKPPHTQIIEVAADAEVAVEPPPVAPEPPPALPNRPAPPLPRRAGFPDRGIYVGLLAGGNVTLIEWNLGTDTKGAHPTSSATGGARVGVQLVPRLAVEGEVGWVGLPNRVDDGHGLTTSGNVLFHILRGKWTPIVQAGAGSYQVLSSALGADADLRVHAGAGLRGTISDWLHVRADVRDVITDGFDKSIGNNLEMLLGVETYVWERK